MPSQLKNAIAEQPQEWPFVSNNRRNAGSPRSAKPCLRLIPALSLHAIPLFKETGLLGGKTPWKSGRMLPVQRLLAPSMQLKLLSSNFMLMETKSYLSGRYVSNIKGFGNSTTNFVIFQMRVQPTIVLKAIRSVPDQQRLRLFGIVFTMLLWCPQLVNPQQNWRARKKNTSAWSDLYSTDLLVEVHWSLRPTAQYLFLLSLTIPRNKYENNSSNSN